LLRAALAQVDLVEVGLEDRALVVARFDQQREQDLVELAGVGLLAADAQGARARQLLGQRAAALPRLARPEVDPGRAQHAGQVDAVVEGDVAVHDRLPAGHRAPSPLLAPHPRAPTACRPVTGSSRASWIRTSGRASGAWP